MSKAIHQYHIDPTCVRSEPTPKVKTASLSELAPNMYSTVHALVIVMQSREKEDKIGKGRYIFGICEDATYRIPFISYKPCSEFYKGAVVNFQDCYSTRDFLDVKQRQVRAKTRNVLENELNDFAVDDYLFGVAEPAESQVDATHLLLEGGRCKLYGRTMKATGSVVGDERRLHFIPRTVDNLT